MDLAEIVQARLFVAALAPISIGTSLWFWKVGVYQKSRLGRYRAIGVLGFGLFGVAICQVLVFRAVANVNGRIDDVGLYSIIITQMMIPLYAVIAFARSERGKP